MNVLFNANDVYYGCDVNDANDANLTNARYAITTNNNNNSWSRPMFTTTKYSIFEMIRTIAEQKIELLN